MRQGSNSFTESSHDLPCIAARSLKSILLCNSGTPADSCALQPFKLECNLNPASSCNLIFRFSGSLFLRLRLWCWWVVEKSVSRDSMTVATPSLSNKRNMTIYSTIVSTSCLIHYWFTLHAFIGVMLHSTYQGPRVKMLIVVQSPHIIVFDQIDTLVGIKVSKLCMLRLN